MRDLPNESDLERLPLRAILAYAARCARRAQPVFNRGNQFGNYSSFGTDKGDVDAAITFAEEYCVAGAIPREWEIDYVACSARAGRAAEAAARAAYLASHPDVASRAAATGWITMPVAEEDKCDFAKAANAARVAALAALWVGRYASGDVVNLSDAQMARMIAAEAVNVARLAIEAAGTDGDIARHAATADYERLASLALGKSGNAGPSVDPSEKGPLGPLWPASSLD